MTGRITRWLWLAFAAIAIGLPFLPLARPNGAPPPDLGPPWAPNVTAWGIGLALVLVAAVASGRLAKGLPARRIGIGPRLSSPVFLTLLAVGLAAWSVYTVRSVFASNPVLIDEMAQLFHARVFASASLAAPAPEPAAAFLIQHTWITDAGWVSLYPPGHPLALAIGMVLRAEWLVDPVLGGVCVFLVYLVAKGLYGPKTARIAALLWAISAWVMFMSASYMNHVTATTLALACWALVWAPRPPGRLHVVAAGLCLAAVAATRPLDAVAAGLPVLVWIVARRRWAVIPWMALGTLPVVIAFGYFNWRLFGGPLTLGYNALYGSELNLGFGIDPWGRPFTPVVALANLAVAMRRLHLFLYEWPIPALLPLGLWALAGRQRRAADAIVAIGLLAVPALYFFYWHSGYYPGPRFYYGAAPFLIIGTARAWRWGWALARRSSRPWWRGDVALVSAAVIVLIWGWAGVLPARFAAFRTGLATLKLHPEREVAARGVRQALVIVPERWGSRLVVSLWELGIRPGLAERAFNWLDACDLQRFVDAARAAHMSAEEATRRVEAAIRATPVPVPRSPGSPDETLHLRTDRPLDAVCQREVQRDQAGFTLFGYLAWRNAIGLHSGIVFARDLYERNAELFARYPGWAIWRYAPPASNPNALPILTQVVTP